MCRIRECRGERVNKQKDKREIKTKCINYKSRIVLIDEKIEFITANLTKVSHHIHKLHYNQCLHMI